MKRGPSLLQKVWRKLRPAKPAPAAPVAKPKTEPPAKRASSLEPLEGRIAPAALLNPNTLVYKDIDGDIVTVKFSKPLFNKNSPVTDVAAMANNVFKFNSGNVEGTDFTVFDPTTAVAQQLQLIDLTLAPTSAAVGNLANGISFTVTAVKGSLLVEGSEVAGDGLAHVGFVKAKGTTSGLTLGTVSIAGDLGQIDAGNNNAATAIKALKVQSLGVKGLTTQAATGASLESNISGALGSLTVAGSIQDASVRVVNSFVAFGRIGSVTIGGSLIGTSAVATSSDNTGLIEAAGDIGAIRIGGDLKGGGGATSGGIL